MKVKDFAHRLAIIGILQDSSSFPTFESGQIDVVRQEINEQFHELSIRWSLVVYNFPHTCSLSFSKPVYKEYSALETLYSVVINLSFLPVIPKSKFLNGITSLVGPGRFKIPDVFTIGRIPQTSDQLVARAST
jgi:hypothetical protein